MAFFKFRWPGQGEQAQAEKPSKRPRTPQAESIEVMRRRARHRLIGAAVLVLIGVIGFPMLFDTQPRPIPVDIPIEIPDRNKVAPLVVPAPVAEAPSAAKPGQRPDEAARARALLEGRSAEPATAAATAEEARFIVHVGAFADADKAREARTKVERAGMKTYTQVVDTKEGKRTRVRVGPFTNRAEADKAAARIKALDLSASVLTL